MKKFWSLLIASLFIMQTQAFANNIEIQPTLNTKTNVQDRVWVGSFQLVWNDFIDKIVFNPIRFREGTPAFVQELNKQSFTTDDISERAYYKFAGKITKNTKKQIAKGVRKKFKESSDLLDKLDLAPRNDKFILYAMLKKDFEFLYEFDKLGKSIFNDDFTAEYFGITKDSDRLIAKTVDVLFYNSPDDFAIALKTKGTDKVYLYKNSSNKPFSYILEDMRKKEIVYKGNPQFAKNDELRIPNLTISEEKVFEELSGKRVMGTNLVIDKALETIMFNMNNKGVKLKSEAAMTIATTSLLPEDEPRIFNFDKTFVLFLIEKDKENPYFALRVNDITKFQKKD